MSDETIPVISQRNTQPIATGRPVEQAGQPPHSPQPAGAPASDPASAPIAPPQLTPAAFTVLTRELVVKAYRQTFEGESRGEQEAVVDYIMALSEGREELLVQIENWETLRTDEANRVKWQALKVILNILAGFELVDSSDAEACLALLGGSGAGGLTLDQDQIGRIFSGYAEFLQKGLNEGAALAILNLETTKIFEELPEGVAELLARVYTGEAEENEQTTYTIDNRTFRGDRNRDLWRALKVVLSLGGLPFDDQNECPTLLTRLRQRLGLSADAVLDRELLIKLLADKVLAARARLNGVLGELQAEQIMLAASTADRPAGFLRINDRYYLASGQDSLFETIISYAQVADNQRENQMGPAAFLSLSASTWGQREGDNAARWQALELYLYLLFKIGVLAEEKYYEAIGNQNPRAAIEIINNFRRENDLRVEAEDAALIDSRFLRLAFSRYWETSGYPNKTFEDLIGDILQETSGEIDEKVKDYILAQINQGLAPEPGEALNALHLRQILIAYGGLLRDGYVESLREEYRSYSELVSARDRAPLTAAYDRLQALLIEVKAGAPADIGGLSDGQLLQLLTDEGQRARLLPHNPQARGIVENFLQACRAYYGEAFSDERIFARLFLSPEFEEQFLSGREDLEAGLSLPGYEELRTARAGVVSLMGQIETREERIRQIESLPEIGDRLGRYLAALRGGGEFEGRAYEGSLADLKTQLEEKQRQYTQAVLSSDIPLWEYLSGKRLEVALQFYNKMTRGLDEWIEKIARLISSPAPENERLAWADNLIETILPGYSLEQLQNLAVGELTGAGALRERSGVEERRAVEDKKNFLDQLLNPRSGLYYQMADAGVYRGRVIEDRAGVELNRRVLREAIVIDYQDISNQPYIYLLGSLIRAGLTTSPADPLSGEWVAKYLVGNFGGAINRENYRSVISSNLLDLLNDQSRLDLSSLAGQLVSNDRVLDLLISGPRTTLGVTREEAFTALNRLSRGDETVLLVFKREGDRVTDLSFVKISGEGAEVLEGWIVTLLKRMLVYYYSLYIDQPSSNIDDPQVISNLISMAQNYYFMQTGGRGGVSAIGYSLLRDLLNGPEWAEITGTAPDQAAPILAAALQQAQQTIVEMARTGSFSTIAQLEQSGQSDRAIRRMLGEVRDTIEQRRQELQRQVASYRSQLGGLSAQVGDTVAGQQYVAGARQQVMGASGAERRRLQEQIAAQEDEQALIEKAAELVGLLVSSFARAMGLRGAAETGNPLIIQNYFAMAQDLVFGSYQNYSGPEATLLLPVLPGAESSRTAQIMAIDAGLVAGIYNAICAQRATISPAEASAPRLSESSVYEAWRDWFVMNTSSQGERQWDMNQYDWVSFRPQAAIKLFIYRSLRGPNPIIIRDGQPVFDPTIRSTDLRYLAGQIRETREFGLPEVDGEEMDIEDVAQLLEKAADIIAAGRFVIEDRYIRHPQEIAKDETRYNDDDRRALNYALGVVYNLYDKVVGLAFPAYPEMRDQRAAQREEDEGWGFIPEFRDRLGYLADATFILPSPAMARDPEIVDPDRILALKEEFDISIEPTPEDPAGTWIDRQFIEDFIGRYGALLEQSYTHWMTGRQPEPAESEMELKARENPIEFLREFLDPVNRHYTQPFALAHMDGDNERLSAVKRMLQRAISLWQPSGDFPILGFDMSTGPLAEGETPGREWQFALDTVASYIRGQGEQAEGHLYGLRLKGFLIRQRILNLSRDGVSLSNNLVNAAVARFAGRRFRAFLTTESATPEGQERLLASFFAQGLRDITWEAIWRYVETLEGAQGDWSFDLVYGASPDGLEEISDALQVFIRAVLPMVDPPGTGEQPALIMEGEIAAAAAAAAREARVAPQSLGDIDFSDPVGYLGQQSPIRMVNRAIEEGTDSALLRLTLKFVEFKFLMMPTIQLGMQLGFLYQMLNASGPFAAYDREQAAWMVAQQGANFVAFRFNVYALIKNGILAWEHGNKSEAIVNFVFGWHAINNWRRIIRTVRGGAPAREFRRRISTELQSFIMEGMPAEAPQRSAVNRFIRRVMAEFYMAPRRAASFVVEPITETVRVINRVLGGKLELVGLRAVTMSGHHTLTGRRALVRTATEMSTNPNRDFTFRVSAPGIAPGDLRIRVRGGDYVSYLRRSVDPFKLDTSIVMLPGVGPMRNTRYLNNLAQAMIEHSADPESLFEGWTETQREDFLRREAARRNIDIRELPKRLAVEAVQSHLRGVQQEIQRMGFYGGFYGRSRMERFLIWADRRRAVREFAEGRPDRPASRPTAAPEPLNPPAGEFLPFDGRISALGAGGISPAYLHINFSNLEVAALQEIEGFGFLTPEEKAAAQRRLVGTLVDRGNRAGFNAEFEINLQVAVRKAVEELTAQGIDPNSPEGKQKLKETIRRYTEARQVEIARRIAREVAKATVLARYGLALEPRSETVRDGVRTEARRLAEEAGIGGRRGRRMARELLSVLDANYEALYRSERLAFFERLLGPADLEARLGQLESSGQIEEFKRLLQEYDQGAYRNIAARLLGRAVTQEIFRKARIGVSPEVLDLLAGRLNRAQVVDLARGLRRARIGSLTSFEGLAVGVDGLGNVRRVVDLGGAQGFSLVEPPSGRIFTEDLLTTLAQANYHNRITSLLARDFSGINVEIAPSARLTALEVEKIRIGLERTPGAASITVLNEGFVIKNAAGEVITEAAFTRRGGISVGMEGLYSTQALRAMAVAELAQERPRVDIDRALAERPVSVEEQARILGNLIAEKLSGSQGLARARRVFEAAALRGYRAALGSTGLITMLGMDEFLRLLDIEVLNIPSVHFALVVGSGEVIGNIVQQRLLNPAQTLTIGQHAARAAQGLGLFTVSLAAWNIGLDLAEVSPESWIRDERYGGFMQLLAGAAGTAALTRAFSIVNPETGAARLGLAGRVFANAGLVMLASQLIGGTVLHFSNDRVQAQYAQAARGAAIDHPVAYAILSNTLGDFSGLGLINLFDPDFVERQQQRENDMARDAEEMAGGLKNMLAVLLMNMFMARQAVGVGLAEQNASERLDPTTREGFAELLRFLFSGQPSFNTSPQAEAHAYIQRAMRGEIFRDANLQPLQISLFSSSLASALKREFGLDDEQVAHILGLEAALMVQENLASLYEYYDIYATAGDDMNDLFGFFDENGLLRPDADVNTLIDIIEGENQEEIENIYRGREALAMYALLLCQFSGGGGDLPLNQALLDRYAEIGILESSNESPLRFTEAAYQTPAFKDALEIFKANNRPVIVAEMARLLQVALLNGDDQIPENMRFFLDGPLGLLDDIGVINSYAGSENGGPSYWDEALQLIKQNREMLEYRAQRLANYASDNGLVPTGRVSRLDVELGIARAEYLPQITIEDQAPPRPLILGYRVEEALLQSAGEVVPTNLRERLKLAADAALFADPQELNRTLLDLNIYETDPLYQQALAGLTTEWAAERPTGTQGLMEKGLYRLLWCLYEEGTSADARATPLDILEARLFTLQGNERTTFARWVRGLLPQFRQIRAALQADPNDQAALLALNLLCLRAAGAVERTVEMPAEETKKLALRLALVVYRDHSEQGDLLSAAVVREALVGLGDDLSWEQDADYRAGLLQLATRELESVNGDENNLALRFLQDDVLRAASRLGY